MAGAFPAGKQNWQCGAGKGPAPHSFSGTTRKNPEPDGSGIDSFYLDCPGYLTGTQASGTNIYMARRTVDNSLDTFHIGLPGTIAASVGVGNLDSEGNALIAKLALSHPLHLLAIADLCPVIGTADIITDNFHNCKRKFQKKCKTLQSRRKAENRGESVANRAGFIYNKAIQKMKKFTPAAGRSQLAARGREKGV